MFNISKSKAIPTHQIFAPEELEFNKFYQKYTSASDFSSKITLFQQEIEKNKIWIESLKQIKNMQILKELLDSFYFNLLKEANTMFFNNGDLQQQLQSFIQNSLKKLVQKHSESQLYQQIQRTLKDLYKQKEKEIIELYQNFNNQGDLQQVYDEIYLQTETIINQFQQDVDSLPVIFTIEYKLKLQDLILIEINPIINHKIQNPPIIKVICIEQMKYYLQNQELNWEYSACPSQLVQNLLAIILSIHFKYEEQQFVFEAISKLEGQFSKSNEICSLTEKCLYLSESIKHDKQFNMDQDDQSKILAENQKQYNFLQKLNEQYNSDQFWETQISEEENLRTIINIIIQLSGFKFIEKNQFSIDRYQPECRSIMIKIANRLQNKKYNYLNISIIQTMEELFGKLQLDLLNQINQYIGMNDKVSKLQFQFQCQLSENIIIPLNLQIGDLQMYQNEFTIINSLQHPFQQFDLKTIKQNCCQLIEKTIDKIYQDYLHKKMAKPKFIFFQQVSLISQPSNVITICISGFTSENDCKAKKWEQLTRSTNSQVIGLNFQSSIPYKIIQEVALTVTQIIIQKSKAIPVILSKLYNNDFLSTEREAERVGVYLGYLIGHSKIFGNSLINLVGFSLGTVVIQKCIETLDTIHKECGNKFLNDVLLMGGAAKLQQLKNCDLESINGRLINVYSKNDLVLRSVYQMIKLSKPCGLSKLTNISHKVRNFDLTHLISGHLEYEQHQDEILKLVGFDKDINV